MVDVRIAVAKLAVAFVKVESAAGNLTNEAARRVKHLVNLGIAEPCLSHSVRY
jgi:hypothetical protein